MSTFSPAPLAADHALLQSHGAAITVALLALQRVSSGVLGLAVTGSTAAAADLARRRHLLQDVVEGAADMAVLIEALVAAELDPAG